MLLQFLERTVPSLWLDSMSDRTTVPVSHAYADAKSDASGPHPTVAAHDACSGASSHDAGSAAAAAGLWADPAAGRAAVRTASRSADPSGRARTGRALLPVGRRLVGTGPGGFRPVDHLHRHGRHPHEPLRKHHVLPQYVGH